MTAPNVTGSIVEGGLAIPAQTGAGKIAIIGTSTLGTVGQIYAFGQSTATQVRTTIGYGAGAQAVGHVVNTPGHGEVYFTPATATAGRCSSVTSSGTSPPTVTLTGTPVDFGELRVEILTAGTATTATARYSLDGGRSWSATFTLASTVVITNSGVTLNFAAGSYSADNVYTATFYAPSISTANLAAAMDVLKSSGREFDVVGVVTSWDAVGDTTDALRATAWATHYGAAITEVTELRAANKPALLVMGAPAPYSVATPSDYATWAAALVAKDATVASDADVVRCAGPVRPTQNALDSWQTRRPDCLVPVLCKLSAVGQDIHRDIGEPGAAREGAIPWTGEFDEYATPGLDSARFVTTVYDGGQWFLTRGITSASPSSDFVRLSVRRVANKLYKLVRSALRGWLNRPLETVIGGDYPGALSDAQASVINSDCTSRAANGMGDNVVALKVKVDQTNNVSTTENLTAEASFQKYGYAGQITFKVSAKAAL